MKYRQLGRSGLGVHPLCLGTMTFGLQVDKAGSFEILDAAADHGFRFLDTANVYPLGGGADTVGATEAIIGEWFASRGNRTEWVVATKCFGAMGRGLNDRGLSRAHIVSAVEDSLRRLQTDVIDLYQSHGFDPNVPIDETMRAFDDLIRAGKVRYIGASNYPAWRLMQSLGASDAHNVARYASVQPRYNMLYRDIETELVPLCIDEGLGVLVYNPLAGGFLSCKYREPTLVENTRFTLGNAAERYQNRYWQDVYFNAVSRLRDLANAHGVNMVSLAIAWTLDQKGITSAIVGASNPGQLDANVAALDLTIDDELRQACDDIWWDLPRRPVADGYR